MNDLSYKIGMTIVLSIAALWFSFAGAGRFDKNPRLTLVGLWTLCAVMLILIWLGVK
jgi:hypothetical protein